MKFNLITVGLLIKYASISRCHNFTGEDYQLLVKLTNDLKSVIQLMDRGEM